MIIRTKEDFNEFAAWAKSKDMLAYDIETSGLDARTERIIGIGVSDFSRGFYLPILEYNAANNSLEFTASSSYVNEFLSIVATKQIICFNGAFDLPFTKHNLDVDLVPKLHTDVLLLKHTVDEEYPFKLKEIATQIFGYGAAQDQRDLHEEVKAAGGSKHDIYMANVATIGRYCVQDCLLTYKLYVHYRRILSDQELEKFFYEDEVMPLYREVTIPMENYGIKLDLPLMQQTLQEITADINALEAKILAEIEPYLDLFYNWFLNKDYKPSRTGRFAQGIAAHAQLDLPKTASGNYSLTAKNIAKLPESRAKAILEKREMLNQTEIREIQRLLAKEDHGDAPLFNLQSKHHLKKLFFDTLKLTPLSTTDLGNPQVDDNFIESISDQYSWAHDLHIYNRLQKIKSTYIERFIEGANGDIFYPSFFQHRTISGRFGSDLQQLPRPVSEESNESELVIKYNNRIRNFFISRPNHVFVGADYESLEPHIFAHVSGDELLQNIFRQGLDFYSEIAIRTEKLEGVSSNKSAPNYLGKVNKEKRQSSKAYALGVPYGLQGYKLSFQLGCTPEEGDLLVNNYLNAFPALKKWMQDSQTHVLEHGYIKSQAGRIRHLPRAKEYHRKYGLGILDPLQLYKDYGKDEYIYNHMKKVRKELKNYLNNANNFQIQSLAASIVNRAAIAIMREFAAKGLKAQICMNVHDELVCECPQHEMEQVKRIMQTNMENIMPLSLPLHAEPQVATKYGETK